MGHKIQGGTQTPSNQDEIICLKIEISAPKSMINNTSPFYKNRLFFVACLVYNPASFHNRDNYFPLGCGSQACVAVVSLLWVYED